MYPPLGSSFTFCVAGAADAVVEPLLEPACLASAAGASLVFCFTDSFFLPLATSGLAPPPPDPNCPLSALGCFFSSNFTSASSALTISFGTGLSSSFSG